MIRLRPKPHGYDERHYLLLRGSSDLAEGENVKVCLGESVVCGRSRHCEWSLKRSPGYLGNGDGQRQAIRESMSWRTTSRRHCRITYVAPDMVDIENLSSNGTLVDGHRIDRVVLTDCRTKAHHVTLGPHGVTLSLEPGALPLEIREPEPEPETEAGATSQ